MQKSSIERPLCVIMSIYLTRFLFPFWASPVSCVINKNRHALQFLRITEGVTSTFFPILNGFETWRLFMLPADTGSFSFRPFERNFGRMVLRMVWELRTQTSWIASGSADVAPICATVWSPSMIHRVSEKRRVTHSCRDSHNPEYRFDLLLLPYFYVNVIDNEDSSGTSIGESDCEQVQSRSRTRPPM